MNTSPLDSDGYRPAPLACVDHTRLCVDLQCQYKGALQVINSARSSMLLWLFALATTAQATDARFQVDSAVSLITLAEHGTPRVVSGRDNGVSWVDASAVLSGVDVERLFAAAKSYERYVDFGMPYLNDSRVIERTTPQSTYIWASMAYSIATIDLSSQYFLQVQDRNLPGTRDARGLAWTLVPKKPDWTQSEHHPSFSKNDGSFYAELLQDGRVYVRYFIASDIKVPLGRLGADKLVERSLRHGAAAVITALAKQAHQTNDEKQQTSQRFALRVQTQCHNQADAALCANTARRVEE